MELYVLLGAPGTGKGTMCEILAEKNGFFQLSTGQVFREEIAAGTALGATVKGFMDKGDLVPDDIVVGVAAKYIAGKNGRVSGIVLDGFPRTVSQAEALDKTLKMLKLNLTGVVLLEASEDLLVVRLTGRRVCRGCGTLFHIEFSPPKNAGICDACGGQLYQRSDDSEQTCRNRLGVYAKQTMPLVDYYRNQNRLGRVRVVNDKSACYQSLLDAMEQCRKKACF